MNQITNKKCNCCNLEKEINVLNYRQKKYPSGKLFFDSICKKCQSAKAVILNKKRIKTVEQKQKFAAYKKEWKLKNKDRENFKYREKLLSDMSFRLRKNIARSIHRYLTAPTANKNIYVKNYLNYNIEQLKNHLQSQFNNEMNWDNYGIYWHIDHIIPQSCLPYASFEDENFKKCWDLKNLRPLEAKQNMLDGSTRVRHKIYKNNIMEKYNA